MPFKNTSSYLEECVDSILAQTYENWELIAVDDSSTDHSRQIMESYSEKDARIKVYSNPSKGIIPALREAFKRSTGDYISRMDSDDMMRSHKLETLAENLRQAGKGKVSVGQVRYFSDSGISDGYARYERWINGLTATGANYSEIYKECVIPSPCWMVHREDLERVGAFKPNRYPEDYDLTFRFYKEGLKCIPCMEVLHLWRDYPERTSRTSEHYAQNYFLDIKIHYFLELDYDPERPLAVWGAGTKGKTIAKYLKEENYEFFWLCDNPNKIGKKIYGQELQTYHALESMNNPQSIITVANESAQMEIQDYFSRLAMQPMSDYFFFC